MTERVEASPAFVLHRRPYRETSLLLELITPDHGRLGAVARGARAPKSRLRGHLQPFLPLHCDWVARGELATLTGAEAQGPPLLLRPPATLYGLYLNELLLRLLPRRDPQPDLFQRYAHTLAHLAGPEPEAALRLFERDLLALLGYALELRRDHRGAPIDPQAHYRYDGHAPRASAADDPEAIPGAVLLALAEGRLEAAHLPHAKRLTRARLAPLLGSRPLESRRLFRAYLRSG